MLKMSIVTEPTILSLGVNGIQSFFLAFGVNEIDTLQKIDDTFLDKCEQMPVYPFGFTIAYKCQFLDILYSQRDKFCLVVPEFLTGVSDKSKFLTAILRHCNNGSSIAEALQKLNITTSIS